MKLAAKFDARRRAVLAALASPALARSQDQKVAFAGGKVEVQLPASVRIVSNEKQSLAGVFGPQADHKVEMTLHEDAERGGPEDSAEQFVREQARKKNLRLQQLPGKSLFMERGAESTRDGKPYRTLHMQVGFGKSLVVITLTAPFPLTPVMNEFLGTPLNAMVASLKRR